MMYTLAFLAVTLGIFSSCSGLASGGPGACKNLPVDPDFSLSALSSVHGGAWSYAQIVLTENTDKFKSVLQAVVPSGVNDEYNRIIYYRDSDGILALLRQTTESESSTGEPFVSVVGSDVYKTYVLKYTPEYAVVYVCSDEAEDNGFDYWYVLCNGQFTVEQELAVQDIKDKYGLRGETKRFDLFCL